LKPKELFKLLSIKDSEISDEIDKWLNTNFNTLLPEEVVMTLRMSDGKHQVLAQKYLSDNLTEMSLDEVSLITIHVTKLCP
jgi:hypothetical protein